MLEAYSTNQTVAQNSSLTFNTVALEKGFSVVLQGVSSVQFNRCGVYEVTLDVSGTPSEAGEVTIVMLKDGVTQSQAIIDIPLTVTTASVTASKKTLVQVPNNNSQCCCDIPTTITFVNTGVGLASLNSHLTITKVR